MATAETRKLRERPPLRRPTEDEIKQARDAIRLIEASPSVRMTIRDEDGAESRAELPPLALALLTRVLDELSKGNALILEPVPRLLTIPQASELLGASWTFVRELIEKGELPCEMVDEEQRVVFEDLMAFERKNYEARSKVLDELVALGQELGMGY